MEVPHLVWDREEDMQSMDDGPPLLCSKWVPIGAQLAIILTNCAALSWAHHTFSPTLKTESD